MAKPRKNETGSKWLGRKNKSRQDAMPASKRERAMDHSDRLKFMQEKRPVRSADWGNVKRAK
jgi:hypothetical protein